jgi:hypothetical protein
MSCTFISSGITKDCSNNVGGLKTIYITELENVDSYTLASPGSHISAITMAVGAKFYEYQFNKNTSSFTEVQANNQQNGTELVTQTITLKFNRREQTKYNKIKLLGNFKDLAVIIKDSNDLYFFVGLTNGMNLTEINSATGVSKTDSNNYTLTLVGEEPILATEVASSVISGIVA